MPDILPSSEWPTYIEGRPSGTATLVYDGTADVQEGQVTRRTAGGDVYKVGDARAFLPAAGHGIEAGDAVTITWADGTTQGAIVAETRRLDDSLVLTYAD